MGVTSREHRPSRSGGDGSYRELVERAPVGLRPGAERGSLPAPRPPEPGPLLFARFALPPNRLGYCGGDEAASLLQHIAAGIVDEDLLRQCRDFEGAYPYLRLIAESGGIADPLARSVVEGYWLAGPALRSASRARLVEDLEIRFRPRTPAREWRWLAAKPSAGALPHHSFHVLEVLPRVGLLRAGIPTALVPTLEQCLVRPARVVAVDGDALTVAAPRLSLLGGRLRLRPGTQHETEVVASRADGAVLVPDAVPGDVVALHWGWACDRLTERQTARLMRETRASMARANATI